MTNFAEKIRPRIIVFDLTIHRENVYQDEAYTKPFVPAIIIVKNNVECSGVDSFLLWGGSTYFCIKFLIFNVVSYL
jgi:hypothetical protein